LPRAAAAPVPPVAGRRLQPLHGAAIRTAENRTAALDAVGRATDGIGVS